MKQIFFNLVISVSCFPVYLLISKVLSDEDIKLMIGALWIGFCGACLINGIVCIFKEL